MSGKRPSLSTIKRSAKASAKPAPVPETAAAAGRPPSRLNKRVVSVYVEPEALKQLRIIAIDEDTSVQALMVEALDDLFVKRGVSRIA